VAGRVSTFLQATLIGLLQGGLLALVAVGFSLVWGVMHIVNFAQGALVVLGAYITWQLHAAFGLDPFLGMFVAAPTLFVLGYVLQRGLINLVVNAPIYITLLLTFGIELLLTNAMVIAFSADYQSVRTSYAGRSLELPFDVHVALGRILVFAVSVLLTVLLVRVITRTRTGLAIRATGMDRGAARLMGIKARHIYALTFGIASALAGAAGAMVSVVSTFSPADVGRFTVLSFVISVLGGLGNMYGALAGGLLLGVIQAWGGQYLPGTYVNAVAFVVLIVVLVLRPQGLVGKAYYGRRLEV
jgi:branched-chain amino acid transport system permease protein